MSKRSRRHQWDESQIPSLPDHSEAKHLILSGYIQKYLRIVCQSRKIQTYNLTLVDGFAGGGIYQNSKVGSPLVMINSVCQAVYEINKDRKDHVVINPHYYFVDNDELNHNSLTHVLAEKHSQLKHVNTIHGDFNTQLPNIIEHIKKRNPRGGGGAIFFLDQDGYSDVSIESLNLIRENLPKAEIIININVSWLIDFIDDSDRFKNTIINIGLANHIDLNEIIELKKDIKENRYIIEAKLSVALKRAARFPYFRPFFIEPEDNHRGYWLLHLAPHYRAHNAMSEVIWENGNFMRHYGGDGARIFELAYKGGIDDMPNIFGNTFNEDTKKEHMNGLARDLPEIIWEADSIEVSKLVESTCNHSAASLEMYKKSLLDISDQGEIIILGKSGGKKTSRTILSSDVIIPKRQFTFDLK